MTKDDDEKDRVEPSETPPRRVEPQQKKEKPQKKKRRRRKKKQKAKQKKFKLEKAAAAAQSSFMLVPKNPELTDLPAPEPVPESELFTATALNGPPGSGFIPFPIFPFGGLLPNTRTLVPGMPLEIGGTTFFNNANFDPLKLLPSHDPIAIMKQVEWYFQPDNLDSDIFLRTSMDERGYVPAEIIASFNRLKTHGITKDEILLCCRPSTIVKVKKDKIKCRELWYTWVLPGDKVTSIVASDDEDIAEEVSAVPEVQTKTFSPAAFFEMYRQPQVVGAAV